MDVFQNLVAGWIGMLFGAASGSLIGLFFHRADWMGGYGSFRRRMLRLGHISFFGIGFINILFALSIDTVSPYGPYPAYASVSLIVALVAMPACCLLAAWRTGFRHLFPIPVVAVVAGVVLLLAGWWPQ